MLLRFLTSGFKLFDESVDIDLLVNKGKNIIEQDDKNILKSAIIYGANNSGKSSFIDAIKYFKLFFQKGDLIDFPFFPLKNFFSEQKPISFEVKFIEGQFIYDYGVEILDENNLKEYLLINDKLVFSRGDEDNIELDKRYFIDEVYQSNYNFLNNTELFISKMNSFSKKVTNEHVNNIHHFFSKLRFFDNNERSSFIDLMIECLENEHKRKLYNNLLKNADISLMGKELTEEIGIPGFDEDAFLKDVSKNDEFDKEDIELLSKSIRVKSIYKHGDLNKKIPADIFDSIGTSKFSNLLLLILNTIEKEEILLIDEIDNSLHFRITRELIKLMNSNMNLKSQFIMSAHDIKLLTPLLFRKEQIYFIERNSDNVDMFSLGDFEDVRNDTNYENLYIKNKIGALPHPDLDEVITKWQEYNLEEDLEN